MTRFDVRVDDAHGESVVVLSGELDAETAPRLKTLLDESTGSVVIDVANLSFVDSVGLSVLIAANNRARQHGDRVVLRHPRRPLLRLLSVTGLTDVFDIED